MSIIKGQKYYGSDVTNKNEISQEDIEKIMEEEEMYKRRELEWNLKDEIIMNQRRQLNRYFIHNVIMAFTIVILCIMLNLK